MAIDCGLLNRAAKGIKPRTLKHSVTSNSLMLIH
jgi:hypothetical protein